MLLIVYSRVHTLQSISFLNHQPAFTFPDAHHISTRFETELLTTSPILAHASPPQKHSTIFKKVSWYVMMVRPNVWSFTKFWALKWLILLLEWMSDYAYSKNKSVAAVGLVCDATTVVIVVLSPYTFHLAQWPHPLQVCTIMVWFCLKLVPNNYFCCCCLLMTSRITIHT